VWCGPVPGLWQGSVGQLASEHSTTQYLKKKDRVYAPRSRYLSHLEICDL
jgi:hypothetical protein